MSAYLGILLGSTRLFANKNLPLLSKDYVSVVQTFTKYTSPYKWNELDMLLSDDSIKSISDEMRHPRISFVILPDPFADQM